jgi:rRNA maturation protein Nop10
MFDFHALRAKYIFPRICFECDTVYTGDIYCPKCGEPSGEPLPEPVAEDDTIV